MVRRPRERTRTRIGGAACRFRSSHGDSLGSGSRRMRRTVSHPASTSSAISRSSRPGRRPTPHWTGVSVDTLFAHVEPDPVARYLSVWCDGGYTTNLPVADVQGGQAFIAYRYEDEPLAPEHGGPARLVVPHLYFWKSAKWVRGLRLTDRDTPGFWESLGYHNDGDPWKEQRYSGD